MNFYKDLGEDSVPEEEAGRESIAEGSGQSDNETLPERAGGIEDSPQGNKIEEIDLSDEEEALKPELKKLGHYFDVNGGRHIVPAEEAERRQNLEDLKEKNIVGAWGGASYLEERNRLLHPSLDIPKPNFLPVEDKVEGKLAEAFEGKLREERNTAVRRAFGDHVSPEEMERIATSKLPIEPVPLDSSSGKTAEAFEGKLREERNTAVRRAFGDHVSPEEMERIATSKLPIEPVPLDSSSGKTAASLGENPPSYDSIGDFYTWLKGTGGRYGDLNDILSANYEQARRDYNDLISPEAKRAREKANESRKRLAVLGDIGLVLGDIVGAAAGGNVNRRDKTAQMVNAERELADEAMLQQRESALLQRYRQAADRGLANARQDYQTALQRYLKDQDNDIKRIQLGIQLNKLANEQARWEKEFGLKESEQAEKKEHNDAMEEIGRTRANAQKTAAETRSKNLDQAREYYDKNTFPIASVNGNDLRVSDDRFGKIAGELIEYTGKGVDDKGDSIIGAWKGIKGNLASEVDGKKVNTGIMSAMATLENAAYAFVDPENKKLSRKQMQDYVNSIIQLYNLVNKKDFSLEGKQGGILSKGTEIDTGEFVDLVNRKVDLIIERLEDISRESYDDYYREIKDIETGYRSYDYSSLPEGDGSFDQFI